MNDMDKALAEMMAVGMVLDMCGLTTPEQVVEFERRGSEIAQTLVLTAQAEALGISVDEIEDAPGASLAQLAQASFALDQAATVMKEHLQKAMVHRATTQMVEGLLGALGEGVRDEGARDERVA